MLRATSIVVLRPPAHAAFLGVTTRTLRRWRSAGIGPNATVITQATVFYARAELAAWLVRKTEGSKVRGQPRA
jgi:hypothetical protein